MTHSMRGLGLIGLALLTTCGMFSRPLRAQYAQLPRDSYGQGVNAYLAGRSGNADALLSNAIGEDAENISAYYFRGLARLRLDRVCEARDDMQIGAALEASHPRSRAIGKLLERVQGCDRLLLEKYRHESQAAAKYARESAVAGAARSAPAAAAIPPQLPIADSDAPVLRQRILVPLDELLNPSGPRTVSAGMPENWADASASAAAAPATAEEVNPFGDDTAEKPAPASPAIAPPPADAPARPEAAPATPPAAEDNPFESF